jgi:hypothetical protein
MQSYQIKLTGTQPLIMHCDNVEWADEMGKWKDDKDNRKLSKPGDDRTPAWRWLGCLYHDSAKVHHAHRKYNRHARAVIADRVRNRVERVLDFAKLLEAWAAYCTTPPVLAEKGKLLHMRRPA